MINKIFTKQFVQRYVFGPTLSLVATAFFLFLDTTSYALPSSPGVLSTIVIFIAFRFGIFSGMASALISWIYTVIHFSIPGSLFQFTDPDFSRVMMWAFTYPIQAAMIGILKERLIAKVESEKLLQQKLIASAKLSALGEMASGIAHEVNSPLGAIILSAEMIELINFESDMPNPDIARRAQTILKGGQRVSKIISGLRLFSRETSNEQKTMFSGLELIESTIIFCSEKFKKHKIELRLDDNLNDVKIYGKKTQLSQTLLNLLNNSFDAVSDLEKKWVHIKIQQTAQFVEIKVIDSGNRISNQVAEKIFQPFFTTKTVGQGTGLGLSISKGIVSSHGGDLFYEEANPNTCFVIQLPTN
ncbi:MAG: HAMP domain-containing sensor histidine kinase [Pseudobdellovibrio sp.]